MAKGKLRGEQIKDESIKSVDLASGSINAGELNQEAISGQTLITAIDAADDRLLVWDATDSALKRVAPEKLFEESGTQVGIGTTSPSKDLDIEGADSATIQLNATNYRAYNVGSDAYGFVVHDATTGGTAGYRFVISDQAAALGYVGIGAGASIAGSNHPDALLHLSSSDDGAILRVDTTDGTTVLFATGSGHVGIGTASPDNTLHVYADASDYVALIDNDGTSTAHGMKITSDGTGTGTYLLDIEAASTTLFRFRADGRLGIGTTSPTAKLDVAGSIQASGDLYVDKIRRYSDSGTTTKINLNDEVIKIYAGHGSNQTCTIVSDGVAIGAISPNSTFHVSGSQAGNYTATSTTGASALSIDESHFIVNYTGNGNATFTLPNVSAITGRQYHVLHNCQGVNDVLTVTGSGGQFLGTYLGGAQNSVTIEGNTPQSITIVSTGDNWFILHDGRVDE